MKEVIASLRSHVCVDSPPDTSQRLAHLERVHGCRLPEDFKELYRSVGGAALFRELRNSAPQRHFERRTPSGQRGRMAGFFVVLARFLRCERRQLRGHRYRVGSGARL